MRAGIYLRISDDREGRALGVQRQLTDCQDLSDRNGWTVASVYEDNDVSAYSGKKRPAYERMMDDIHAGRLDVIVAWANDRLHRHPRELEDFIDAVEASQAEVHTVTSGTYDLGSPEGRAMARIVGAMARQESERKSVRAKRKHAQLAEAGQGAGGGTRPFGFEDDRVTIRKDEAKLIREAARRLIAGEPALAIIREWQDRGVQTPTGLHWRSGAFKTMIRSGRIAGLRYHRGERVGQAMWKAIISPEDHDRIRAILEERARKWKYDGRGPRRYLLTGLIHCSRCDAKLSARPKADKRRQYVCAKGPDFTGCGKLGVLSEPVEAEVAEQVLAALDAGGLAEAMHAALPDGSDDDAVELAELRTKLTDLATMFADGDLSRAEWQAARDRVNLRMAEVDARMGHTDRSAVLLDADRVEGGVRAAWEAGDVLWRHAFLAAVLERVVLHPAVRGRNFFDPSRVEIIWRA